MTKGEIVGKKVEVVIDGQMSKQPQDGSSRKMGPANSKSR